MPAFWNKLGKLETIQSNCRQVADIFKQFLDKSGVLPGKSGVILGQLQA